MSGSDSSATPPVVDTNQVDSGDQSGGVDIGASNTDISSHSQDATDAKQDAGSSEGKDAKQPPETILSQVQKALEKTSKAEESSASKDQETDKGKTAAEAAGDADSKKADADVPAEFHKHPAWQRITKERDEARAAAKEAETFKDDAQRYQSFQGYLNTTGLSGPQAVEAMDLAALALKDQGKFFEKLSELYFDWAVTLNKDGILPPDLQRQVDEGSMTSEIARNFALERIKAKGLETREKDREETGKATEQSQQTAAITGALQNWLTAAQKADPDFQRKRPLVQNQIRALVAQEGQPKSPQEFVTMSEKALKMVNSQLREVMPAQQRKPEKNPSPVGNGAASRGAASNAPPKSTLEAVRRGLAMSAAG